MKPIIIANWKMNTTLAEAVVLTNYIKHSFSHHQYAVEVVLAPPFLWLYPISELLENNPGNIKLAAQNAFYENKGAFTGEISPMMLKGLVSYILIGHSERRKHFAEGPELITKKIKETIRNGIKAVVCIGEEKKMKLEKRRFGKPTGLDWDHPMFRDFDKVFDQITKVEMDKVLIAYEPLWAIGSGEAATGAYAANIILAIREKLAKKYGGEIAKHTRILYGGSVGSKNIAEFMHQSEIDGALVGGASLKAQEFVSIYKNAIV